MAIDPRVARAMAQSLRKGFQGDQRKQEEPPRWLSRDELHQRIFDLAKELGIELEREPLR